MQAFPKIHLNLVSQLPFSEPDIGQRVPDVSRALRSRPETASAGAWTARRFACTTFSMKVT